MVNIDKLMANNNGPVEFMLTNPKKKNPGIIILENFLLITKPSFIDYLKGGL